MPRAEPAELLNDAPELAALPTLECQGWRLAQASGGAALLAWRAEALAAMAAGTRVLPDDGGPLSERWPQAVVHLQKGRAAVESDLARAWSALEPGGRLLLCGPNDLGVRSHIARLAISLGQEPTILAHRAGARLAAFRRDQGPGPAAPPAGSVTLPLPSGDLSLLAPPGTFSRDGIDPGSSLLLGVLAELPPPERFADLAAGVGVLALAGLQRWPQATALAAEADARAIAAMHANASRAGCADRLTVQWWDAGETMAAAASCDLVLSNPPCHRGRANDLGPALAIFTTAAGLLRPGGRLLVVANRQLPYEAPIARLGRVETLLSTATYKVLAMQRG